MQFWSNTLATKTRVGTPQGWNSYSPNSTPKLGRLPWPSTWEALFPVPALNVSRKPAGMSSSFDTAFRGTSPMSHLPDRKSFVLQLHRGLPHKQLSVRFQTLFWHYNISHATHHKSITCAIVLLRSLS